eukprot:5743741-Pyramimonas_sp.AAC.1
MVVCSSFDTQKCLQYVPESRPPSRYSLHGNLNGDLTQNRSTKTCPNATLRAPWANSFNAPPIPYTWKKPEPLPNPPRPSPSPVRASCLSASFVNRIVVLGYFRATSSDVFELTQCEYHWRASNAQTNALPAPPIPRAGAGPDPRRAVRLGTPKRSLKPL